MHCSLQSVVGLIRISPLEDFLIMSEYQYYEFLAIDRPLDPSEMAVLRTLSSRAEITPTRFQNEYNWGDFKGSPEKLMEKYFDAHVYFANWGTFRLMLRFPRESIDEEMLIPYVIDDVLSFWYGNEHVILEWVLNDEEPDGDWGRVEGWMAQLVPVRDEIERGDFRALYLGWLSGASLDHVPKDEDEPPIPAGLGSLTPAQAALADFLQIDADFLSAAALASPSPADPCESERKMSKWVSGIPQVKAGEYLLLLLQGKSRQAERAIRQDFTASLRNHAPTEQDVSAKKTRSVAELLEEVERVRAKRIKREARERQRQVEEHRRLRERYLTKLAEDFGRHWKQAHELAALGIASAYDKARDLLVDLSEAYSLQQKQVEFSRLVAEFRAAHARRKALMNRLDHAGIK